MYIPIWIIIVIIIIFAIKVALKCYTNTILKKKLKNFIGNNIKTFDTTFVLFGKNFRFYKNNEGNFVINGD